MTVKELKAALDAFPEDAMVVAQGGIWDDYWNPQFRMWKRTDKEEYMYSVDIPKSELILCIEIQ